MVAGASGVDLALLVVAADEGIMPQTQEHLAILEQLRIPAGIPVVTKSDLVEPEWAELVASELAERLASRRSPSRHAARRVGADRGRESTHCARRLAEHARTVASRPADDLFRLPIDRAFSVAGVGTVVTGTAWSGRIALGDAVVLLARWFPRARALARDARSRPRPELSPARARPSESPASAVERPDRGAVLVEEGSPWTPTTALDVEIALEMTAPRPLGARARVEAAPGHGRGHGAGASPRRRSRQASAGSRGSRSSSRSSRAAGIASSCGATVPVATIGGGRVLDPIPPRRRVLWPSGLPAEEPETRFRALAGAPADRRVRRRAPGAARLATWGRGGRWPVGSRPARRVADHWVSTATLGADRRGRPGRRAAAPSGTSERPSACHSRPCADRSKRRTMLPRPSSTSCAATGRIRRLDGVVALAGFAPRVEGGDAEIDRIVQILERASLTPPSLAELERDTGRRDVAAMLRLAATSGRVEAVERDRYYTRAALDRFVAAVSRRRPRSRHRTLSAPAAARDQPEIPDPAPGMGRRQGASPCG